MDNDFYSTNRQKLLFMAKELHKQGYGKLRVIPSLSPSGMYWRCSFFNEEKRELIASNWLSEYENGNSKKEIQQKAQELAALFIKENFDFLKHCRGVNEEYEKWYSGMLEKLTKDELPYAFADWEIPQGIWQTSKGNQIKTLPNEKRLS